MAAMRREMQELRQTIVQLRNDNARLQAENAALKAQQIAMQNQTPSALEIPIDSEPMQPPPGKKRALTASTPAPPQISHEHLKALKAEIQEETTKALQAVEKQMTSQNRLIQNTVLSLHQEMLKWMKAVTPNVALPPFPPQVAPIDDTSGL